MCSGLRSKSGDSFTVDRQKMGSGTKRREHPERSAADDTAIVLFEPSVESIERSQRARCSLCYHYTRSMCSFKQGKKECKARTFDKQ